MPAAVAAVGAFWAAYGTYITIAIAAISAYSANRKASRARQRAKDNYNASLQDRLVMTSTVNGARSRCYGRVRNVDGIVFKGTWGPDNRYYVLVVAHAGHEVDAIEDVYFNDDLLTLASDGGTGFWVQNAPYMRSEVVSTSEAMVIVGTSGSVTLSQTPIGGTVSCVGTVGSEGPTSYTPTVVGTLVTITGVISGDTVFCSYQYTASRPKARIWKYRGTPTQHIGTDLLLSRFPTLINTPGNDDRFAGMCCTVVELEYDQDAFPAGVPNVTITLRGARTLDPRTGITAWSQNPAAIAYDWSLQANGGACFASELKTAAFNAAANACDVSTNFTTPSGVETRPLYQCDIVCRLDAPPDQYLADMVESMAGKWGWAAGQLNLVAGVYRAPVMAITTDWITAAEGIAVVPQPPRTDVVNVFRPTIADAAQNFVAVPVPEVRSAAYIAADGEVLPVEVDLGGVSRNVHAQHICGVFMRDSREGLVVRLPCNWRAYPIELFDVVTLTLPVFGFAAKEFEVVGRSFSVDGGVMVMFKETAASIFDPDSNFDNPNASVNSSLVLPWIVSPIAGLTVTSGTVGLEDGTNQTRVQVSWTAVTGENVRQSGQVEIQYAEAGANPLLWITAPAAAGDATSLYVYGLRRDRHYLFRARAVNTLKVRSAWSYHVLHSVAAPPITGRTIISSSLDVASLSVTGQSGVGGTYLTTSRWTAVGTHTFAATVSGDGFINLVFGAFFSGTPSVFGNALACQVKINVDFDNNGSVGAADNICDDMAYVPTTGASVDLVRNVTMRVPFSFVAGTTYTWPVYAQRFEPASLTLSDFSLSIEMIAD